MRGLPSPWHRGGLRQLKRRGERFFSLVSCNAPARGVSGLQTGQEKHFYAARTATMNSRGNRSKTLPSAAGG